MRMALRVAFVLALTLLGGVTRQLRVRAAEHHAKSQRYEDIYYLPPPGWLPVMSFGFQAAVADLIWCRSLVYFGQELVKKGQIEHIFDYADAIIALDPSFRAPYRWVAVGAVYRPVAFTDEEGLRAASYLERALARWPSDGELHWDYGSLLRFELAPVVKDPAQRKTLLEKAAPHLATAARLGAGPPWLALNSSSLLEQLGRTEQAVRHLEEVYAITRDEAMREQIAERIGQLRSQTYVAAIRAANQEFARQHMRFLPYVSADLFFLIGAPPEPDWAPSISGKGPQTPN